MASAKKVLCRLDRSGAGGPGIHGASGFEDDRAIVPVVFDDVDGIEFREVQRQQGHPAAQQGPPHGLGPGPPRRLYQMGIRRRDAHVDGVALGCVASTEDVVRHQCGKTNTGNTRGVMGEVVAGTLAPDGR